MNDQQITAYKTLASHVLQLAISDLRVKSERERAMRFLTDPDMATERELWLAWLGMNDDGFQKLLRQKVFQGQENKVKLEKAA